MLTKTLKPICYGHAARLGFRFAIAWMMALVMVTGPWGGNVASIGAQEPEPQKALSENVAGSESPDSSTGSASAKEKAASQSPAQLPATSESAPAVPMAERPQDAVTASTGQSSFMSTVTNLPWWVWVAAGAAVLVVASAPSGGQKSSKEKSGNDNGDSGSATGGVSASW